MKEEKKLKTTITFEPNITENKKQKLISWNKNKNNPPDRNGECLPIQTPKLSLF